MNATLVLEFMNNSCASSKHLQTRRFLDTIAQYLTDVHKLVMHIYRLANERSDAFKDHSGNLIDSRAGAPLVLHVEDEEVQDGQEAVGEEGEEPGAYTEGYSFFDSVSPAHLTLFRRLTHSLLLSFAGRG
jgi:carnitine O-acetyltransferase